MKSLKIWALSLALCVGLMACQSSPQKLAIQSLAETGHAVNDSYEGYLSLVVQGKIPTNDVPRVTTYYRDFQVSFGAAAQLAHFATNDTFSSAEVLSAANRVLTAVSQIKGGK